MPTRTKQKTPNPKTKTPAKRKAAAKAVPEKNSDGLQIGDKVPNFSLHGHKGAIKLSELKGKKTILYFYPKDDTSGCTKEACDFQSQLKNVTKAGATLIGISKDSLQSHEKFAKKYNLTFNLGADEDTKLAQTFGVWVEKSMYGRKYMGMDRSTFVIDEKGKIAGVWRNVKVPNHVSEVLAFLQSKK